MTIHTTNQKFAVEFRAAASSASSDLTNELPTWSVLAAELECTEARAREIFRELKSAFATPNLAVYHRRLKNDRIIEVYVEGWSKQCNDLEISTRNVMITRKPSTQPKKSFKNTLGF